MTRHGHTRTMRNNFSPQVPSRLTSSSTSGLKVFVPNLRLSVFRLAFRREELPGWFELGFLLPRHACIAAARRKKSLRASLQIFSFQKRKRKRTRKQQLSVEPGRPSPARGRRLCVCWPRPRPALNFNPISNPRVSEPQLQAS